MLEKVQIHIHLIVGQVSGGLVFDFISDDEVVRIRTILNFAEERLQFDPVGGIALVQNRESEKHIRYEILMLEFQRCILGNGHLEVWDAETELMLGRSETCIPVNCFVNNDFYTEELEKLSKILNQISSA